MCAPQGIGRYYLGGDMNTMVQYDAEVPSDQQQMEAMASHEAAIASSFAQELFHPDVLVGLLQAAMDDARALELHDWMEGVFNDLIARFQNDQSENGPLLLELFLLRFSLHQESVGRFASAVGLYEEYIDRFIDDSFSLGTHLLRLGRLHGLAGDSGAAERRLLECLALREARELPETGGELAPVLGALAQLYLSTGDLGRADAAFSRQVALLKADPRMAKSQILMDAVDSLATVYRGQDRGDEARILLDSVDRPPTGMQHVDQRSFISFVTSHPQTMVVLVQPSEPNCDALLGMLAGLAPSHPRIKFALVDVTRSPFLSTLR